MGTKTTCIVVTLMLLAASCSRNQQPSYKDPKLPVDKRVEDLLGRMTLEEKFWQLFMIPGDLSDGKERYKNGIFGFQVSAKAKSANLSEQMLDYSAGGAAFETAELINSIQKYFVEETRLGIPIIPFDEALHGLVRDQATIFPQSIGLAATWDTSLMAKVATAIAMETRSRGIRQILSPVVDIARDVRWGRVEETYGEDPFLVTAMGLTFTRQFEKNGVIATPKHFLANSGDGGRDSYPIHFNERLLEEVYLPPYRACFKAGIRSVMTSYNSLDGSPCTANNWLLNRKLKEEWGFKGFVISDASAVGGANVLHFTAADYAESTKNAIENGLDVIFQTSYDHYPLFFKAFESGMIKPEAIDKAVRRVLRAKFELGLFENPYIDPNDALRWNSCKEHKGLARKAAQESIVLLKNENNVLPIMPTVKRIALIGTDAVDARLGGYSGPGNGKVNILEGLRSRAGKGVTVNFSPGCGLWSSNYTVVPTECLFYGDENGLQASYFNNTNLAGAPEVTRIDRQVNFSWTLFSPDMNKINFDWYSARWIGRIASPATGTFNIGIEGNDGYRLYLDGKLFIDNWKKQTHRTITKPFHFEKGKQYDIKIEFFESTGNVVLKLIWDVGVGDKGSKAIAEAVDLARGCDVAIVVAGIHEGEFQDRAYLNLPGRQEEMIQKIAATGKPVIVVLVGGSAITMSSWIDRVDGILDVWYPGVEGGNAVADVLFGDYSPAGRLPITFPVHESQLPLYYNHKPTGRGDDYYNLTGQPLFPFGYGLSYTSFEYSNLHIYRDTISANETSIVRFKVRNTGKYAGDEVVQLYLRDVLASVARPVIELKGFQRVTLQPGEEKELAFEVTPELLTMLDANLNPVVEPGDFRVMIGASSKDIRLRGFIHVRE